MNRQRVNRQSLNRQSLIKLASVLCLTMGVASACFPPPKAPPVTPPFDVTACQIEFRTIKTGLEAWRASYGTYPASLAELQGPNGFLDPNKPLLPWTYTPNGNSYTLVGLC